jgi:serine/threonine protein kinase
VLSCTTWYTCALQASPFEGKSAAEAAARPSYNCKADVWSAGVVCYEVLTGRAPFAAQNVAQVVKVSQVNEIDYTWETLDMG